MPLNEVLEHRESEFYDIRDLKSGRSSSGYDEIAWPHPNTKDFRVRKHKGAHFVLQFSVVESQVFAWVTIIGNEEMAGKYTARITVGQDGPTSTTHTGTDSLVKLS